MKVKTFFLFMLLCVPAIILQGQTLYMLTSGKSVPVDLQKVQKFTLGNNLLVISHFGESSESISLFDLYRMSSNKLVTGVEIQPELAPDMPGMLVYPNPVERDIYIKLNDEVIQHEVQVEVVSVIGGVVYRENHTPANGLFILNLPQLQRGIYICRIHNGRSVFSAKFIKK